ncbi:hypothetical protein PspLS_07504 [Pyricularia sp. CBS 133598]|nr:hypothetical protein PspLS_07504 [Pyricularia sp. CBS 133598]
MGLHCTDLPAVKRTNVRPEKDFLGMQGPSQRTSRIKRSKGLNGEREADSEANSEAAPRGVYQRLSSHFNLVFFLLE